MIFNRTVPAFVYLLAEHLDGILAAGEDLIAHGRAWTMCSESPLTSQNGDCERRQILDNVRSYELTLIARVLRAREHALTLAHADPMFASIAKLFAAGTAVLLDAAEEAGDSTEMDFETADGLLPFARSRGLVNGDACSIGQAGILAITDSYLVATRISLGPLLDMTGSFLDALDAQYGVFADGDGELSSAKPVLPKMSAEPPPLTAQRPGA